MIIKVIGEIDIHNPFFIDLQNPKISNFYHFEKACKGIRIYDNTFKHAKNGI